jgi:hypothetical protein
VRGFEYHLLVLAMTAFLMIRGAGAYSVDRALTVASRQAEYSGVSRIHEIERPGRGGLVSGSSCRGAIAR